MKEQAVQRVVEEFWTTMDTNDFRAAGDLLHDEYVLEWPQSAERIRGRENFIAVNEDYPADGEWNFTIHRLLTDDTDVATEVTVTNESQAYRIITFSTIRDGKIAFQTEYWPDPYDPPARRAQWVENMDETDGAEKRAGIW